MLTRETMRRNPFLLGYARREMDLSPVSQLAPHLGGGRGSAPESATSTVITHITVFKNPSPRRSLAPCPGPRALFLWAVVFPQPQIPL